eukprot:TRINITY_DN114_c0_g1_i1.p1 TRINITY_DN114_c0_g1~~TRINITY_DN114_c0_g1_i1.p1  ORF type:complete len:176 (-),score=42.54 TRINITY_DN114_c0_g1_i1:179-706(-)
MCIRDSINAEYMGIVFKSKKNMSYVYFANLPVSVPPVLDTTPCMKEMLNYEDCVVDAHVPQQEVVHPQWPTIWPRLLTDGKLLDFDKVPMHQDNFYDYTYMRPLTKKNKQYLWECEEERFVFKSCLRKVIGLRRSEKHTSWDTAEVSNLQLSQTSFFGGRFYAPFMHKYMLATSS